MNFLMTNLRQSSIFNALLLIQLSLFSVRCFANVKASPQLPISHCYHWLNEQDKGWLTQKYKYAEQNDGELIFKGDGLMGPGLYCAKTLIGSINYGDRVIRVDFVDNTVFQKMNSESHVCGLDGVSNLTKETCDSKKVDVLFYDWSDDREWYIVKNQAVIKSWSATNNQLLEDIESTNKDLTNYNIIPEIIQDYATKLDSLKSSIRVEIQNYGQRTFVNHKAQSGL